MYKLGLLLILFILMFGCSPISPNDDLSSYIVEPVEEKPFYGKADPVLRVECSWKESGSDLRYTACGSAFLTKYKEQKVIVTALHVVEHGNIYRFYTEDRKRIDVLIEKLVVIHGLDTAVFFITYTSAFITPMEPGTLYIGGDCTTIGYPDGKERKSFSGKSINVVTGTTANVDSGMSGGPVVSNGKVVGVISSKVVSSSDGSKSNIYRLSDIFETLDNSKRKTAE